MNRRKGKWVLCIVFVVVAALLPLCIFAFTEYVSAQTQYVVQGRVINSLRGYPVVGAGVEIATDMDKFLAETTTGADGRFRFTLPSSAPGPYEIGVMMRSYRSKEVRGITAGSDITVELEPRGVSIPGRPVAVSSPKSVYLDWPANPELNIKGYNVYRTETTQNGDIVGPRTKLNGAASDVYSGIISGLEYTDATVVKGRYYIYQIEAISAVDRPSDLSPASNPPVKGQWLTVFFPHVYRQTDGMYLWEREDDGEEFIRIPVASRCAYDVEATSMQIVSEITSQLLNASPFQVELTGITAGMAYSANLIPNGAEIHEGYHQVRIAGAGVEERSLYGAGELFNIYMSPKILPDGSCDLLHLVDDAITDDGVLLYNDPWGAPLEVELEDGVYCTGGGCLHGDVDMDNRINADDAQYILDYVARQEWAPTNMCFPTAWDINLDGRVTTQDATLILRFVRGLPINPPRTAKGMNLTLESFAAAAFVAEKEADVAPRVWIDVPSAAVGATARASVLISGAAPLAGFTLSVAYAADEIEYVSVALGSALRATEYKYSVRDETVSSGEDGSVTVAVVGATSIASKSESEILTLTFKRNDGANGPIPIQLTSIDINDPYGHAPRHTDPLAPVIVDTYTPSQPEGEGEESEGEPEGEEAEGEGETPREGEQPDDNPDDPAPKRHGLFSCGASTTSGGLGGDLLLLACLAFVLTTVPHSRRNQT